MLTCLRAWSQVTNFRRVLDLYTCHPNTRVLVSSEEQCAFNSVGFKLTAFDRMYPKFSVWRLMLKK